MHPKFELTQPTMVKLNHAKGRKEHHGEALVLALDLSVTWTTNNRALDMFDPGLREALFSALPPGTKPPADQGELELPISELGFIRLPRLKYPVKLEGVEMTGYTLRLDYGTGGDSDKIVKVCKLKGFEFTPIEGGSVEIHFGISSSADIEGEVVGLFSAYIQENITITLLAPAKVEGDSIDASNGSGAPGTRPAASETGTLEIETNPPAAETKAQESGTKDRGRAATDEFIAQHATPPTTH